MVDSAGTSASYLRFVLGLTTSCCVAFSCAHSGGKNSKQRNVGHVGQGRGRASLSPRTCSICCVALAQLVNAGLGRETVQWHPVEL